MRDESLQEMYRELTDDERRMAAETLDRYLEFAWEIFEEMQLRDP